MMRRANSMQPIGRLDAPAIFATLFEPDIIIPVRRQSSETQLPPAARVARALVDSAMHDLTYPLTGPMAPIRAMALEWIRDWEGRRAEYDCTFERAIYCGFLGLDPEALSCRIVRRFEATPLARTDFIDGRSMGRKSYPTQVTG